MTTYPTPDDDLDDVEEWPPWALDAYLQDCEDQDDEQPH